jgi:hypothetical protein
LALLGKAYESIPPEKVAEYLGITPENVFIGSYPTALRSNGVRIGTGGVDI